MSSENSKDEILKNACSLFAEKGYDAVSVQEVCEKAGITKPTLYYFFGSKKGLLESLIKEKGLALYEALKTACEYRHDFFNSAQEIIKTEINFAKNCPDYFRLHINLMNAPENSDSCECYKSLKKMLDDLMLDFFVKSANEFGNMREREKLYSIMFHNNLISIALNVLSGTVSDSDESLYRITHTLIYGYAD